MTPSSWRLAGLIWALWVIFVVAAVAASGGRPGGHGARRPGNGPVGSALGEGRGSHHRPRKAGTASSRRELPPEQAHSASRRGAERSLGRSRAGSEGQPRTKRPEPGPTTKSKQQLARVPAARPGGRPRKGQEEGGEGVLSWLGLGGSSARAWLREAKAALSSELEGVLLKATRPGDDQVKLKHLELLLAITYQTPPELDPFPPILRKLWSKLLEGDHRTSLKALYILHRLAANGAVEQAAHLQARLSEMMRQTDSRTKTYFFKVESISTEGLSFARDYAAYVLYRACHFSPGFMELTRLAVRSEGEAGRALTPRESEALVELLEEALRRAFAVRLSRDGGDVTELTSVCAEAIFFDVQQVLDILAELLASAPSASLHPETCKRFWDLYHRALDGINAFVSDQAALVAPHGVTLREMKSALAGRHQSLLSSASSTATTTASSGAHPLIEEAESSDEDGPAPELPAADRKEEPSTCRPVDQGVAEEKGKKRSTAAPPPRPPPPPPRRPRPAASVEEEVARTEKKVTKRKRPAQSNSSTSAAEGRRKSLPKKGRTGAEAEKPRDGRAKSARRKRDEES